MTNTPVVRVLVPALNEADNIALLLADVVPHVTEVVVVDNGSSDDTGALAERAGATVIREEIAGYGRACLAGLTEIASRDQTDVIVFLDADRCDDPANLHALIAPIVAGDADMVIGSRIARAEPGALTLPQKFGNQLACFLIRLFWGVRFTDLGPFRAIAPQALTRLDMCDQDFGWTVEMQIKAARYGLRSTEIQVPYYRRAAGRSKISGTINGVFRAGSKILYVIGREFLRPSKAGTRATDT